MSELNQSMNLNYTERYGHHLAKPLGWIAELGVTEFAHRFGGSEWDLSEIDKVYKGCALLLTLDLRDPCLSFLATAQLNELPLCSFVNNDILDGRQVFQVNALSRRITLMQTEVDVPIFLDEIYQLPIPMPARSLKLRPMETAEYLTTEDSYWEICDQFIGGDSFIRVSGPPLWLQEVEFETCRCGRPMNYVASIGYENQERPRGFLEGEAFFLGELTLYFFWCRDCQLVVVTSQST